MRIVVPLEELKLWIIYQENGVNISSANIRIEILDKSNNVILSDSAMTESGSIPGKYEYTFTPTGLNLEDTIIVYYKNVANILETEEYYFDNLDDMDGISI